MRLQGKIRNLKELTRIRNFLSCNFSNRRKNKSNNLKIASMWKGKNSCKKSRKNLDARSTADKRAKTNFNNLEI